MNITSLLIAFGCFQFAMALTGYGQKLTLNLKNAKIYTVIDAIEKETGYTFVYKKKDLDRIRRVDLHVINAELIDVLEKVFPTEKGLSFQTRNSVVIVKALPMFASAEKVKAKSMIPPVEQHDVRGMVTDSTGMGLVGVTVSVKGDSRTMTSTDQNGRYVLSVPENATLVFTMVGFLQQEIFVDGREVIDIALAQDQSGLDEVVVVAFSGKQKKREVVSSVTSINPSELKVPSSNLTTALAGRLAGLIAYQTSGEPGQDNADFFIRGVTSFGTGKVNPLILMDNVEISTDDLSRLHPDDIQSFSILKDATATALYGARGANGVVLVTTKEGKEGRPKISLRLENSFSSPTKTVKMADPITYMRLANEAASTRNPLAPIPYSNRQIDNTISGGNPYVYPAVDWMSMLTKPVTSNQRVNVNINGGGRVARYYIAGSFAQDNGVLKVDKRNNFNNNIDLKKYLLRSNININFTNTTEAVIRVHGTFDDYVGPITGGNDMYRKILQVSPVRFPAYFAADEKYERAEHILFGGYEGDSYMNPYAEMVKGYRQESKTAMMAQIEIKQDLSWLTKGLDARILGNTIRNSGFDVRRAYSPFYYQVANYDRFSDEYILRELNASSGNSYIEYIPGYKSVVNSFYAEAALAYNRTFEKHSTSGMLVGIARNSLTGNAGSLSESLPKRNLGVSGRFTYGFGSRYFAEFNFGYNGSEKFDKGHRWGFFPSFGLGWSVSNEPFWKGGLKDVISMLKLRGTYGLVGNDEIGSERFFYLSQVTIGGGGGFSTGYDLSSGTGISRNGVRISNYPNSQIGWEIAHKTNLGIDVGLFNGKVEILADLFREHRTNILQNRADIPTSMGLWATPQVNVGEALGKGADISVDYNHVVFPGFWFVGRANFTYARSTYKYYEEADYASIGLPWLSRVGNSVSQRWGYVAERLFIDEADVANSPRQDFGEYLAGDIKYKDINGDFVINEADMVPIGRPVIPEINYGFGLSVGYKSIDFSFFFQGSAHSSFWIDPAAMSPFKQTSSGGQVLETGLTQFIADSYWSEQSQNPYARWPRLSNTIINNNMQSSTWFMEEGPFLRFKSAEMGYTLPQKAAERLKLSKARLYINGTNLLMFSRFKLWDVEMGGNGLNYPLQRVFNLGVNISF
ncbi:SusC/RagA family TonB-linked outer membrane protein [Parapedobacter defluvii]|uniref:SusC/RagA family TonB-linked outer membrane protein n=2 Tax=Parapedobacter defluvii TaxID=2045106 RepID=A0ABQ1ME81_9SPHI|nr:TonB-dependent receptor [Parapedobacter defluvii]GGC39298.1 SusC/RagA family TonB-linked outer membrane protein [Parapedobacter defluvii]